MTTGLQRYFKCHINTYRDLQRLRILEWVEWHQMEFINCLTPHSSRWNGALQRVGIVLSANYNHVVIEGRVFTSKSDVYSFGVTLWEIFSFGKGGVRVLYCADLLVPFSWMTDKEASDEIPKGVRLPELENLPDNLWKLMNQCWNSKPESRPTFSQAWLLVRCG